jgi:hypothetical protein
MTYDFNTTHQNGWDLKEHPNLKFISYVVRNTAITPFQQEEYIFAGLSFLTDL